MVITGPEEGPRNAPSPRGGAVLVSLYSWTCITLGVAFARFIIGFLHKVSFGRDDGMILSGCIVYLGATVGWQFAVNAGLGKNFSELSAQDADLYFKANYAAQFLDVIAMIFAKLSSAFLIGRVATQTHKEQTILFGTVIFWAVYSVFAFAFQCGTSRPWVVDEAKCAGGGPLLSVIVLGMLFDVVLSGWIFPILRPLHMDRQKRTTVALLFGARILVPMAAGVQAWAAVKAIRTEDPTWDSVQLAILNQTVASLSLILASLPRIRRFIGAGGSGMLYPQIGEDEIALSHLGNSHSGDEPLKLVPSSSGRFTTAVESGKSKPKERSKGQQDWQKFVSLGSKQDEHTSTSSLFERQEGVILQQEITVEVETPGHGDSIAMGRNDLAPYDTRGIP